MAYTVDTVLEPIVRQFPTGDNFSPDENKAQLLPTMTMVPRTTPNQDHCKPVKPLVRIYSCTMGNCTCGEMLYN